MAINKEGSSYTFTFAIILVIIVGSSLAFTSMALKDKIKKNVNDKKMIDIISSIGFNEDQVNRGNAAGMFDEYIKERLLLDNTGKVIKQVKGAIDPQDKSDPFNYDLRKEYKSKVAKIVQSLKNNRSELIKAVDGVDTQYPLYIAEKEGKTLYIMPMVGTGLWGPIWGYISIEDDFNTIYGATFDHKGETPGLGAEIKKENFEKHYKGLKINDSEGGYVSILARKGGKLPGNEHQVDAITGGTITSNGLNEMVYRAMLIYSRYFKQQ